MQLFQYVCGLCNGVSSNCALTERSTEDMTWLCVGYDRDMSKCEVVELKQNYSYQFNEVMNGINGIKKKHIKASTQGRDESDIKTGYYC